MRLVLYVFLKKKIPYTLVCVRLILLVWSCRIIKMSSCVRRDINTYLIIIGYALTDKECARAYVFILKNNHSVNCYLFTTNEDNVIDFSDVFFPVNLYAPFQKKKKNKKRLLTVMPTYKYNYYTLNVNRSTLSITSLRQTQHDTLSSSEV